MTCKLTALQLAAFWVKAQAAENGCWLWGGELSHNGYGRLVIDGKHYQAHRLAYAITTGEPGDLKVCHKCDTPACIRPSHLFLGTTLDNSRDMVSKNRQAKGDRVPSRRLTSVQVAEIRKSYTGKRGEKLAFAKRFKVHPSSITRVIDGTIRRHEL